ncbi:MAG: O-antigen ligase family protein, partial [Thermoanaerobaculia bacterium]
EWERAQATFTDPSAAGVAVALLLAPLLACAVSSPPVVRLLAGVSVGLLLLILADAGSRAGLVGCFMAGGFFVLWSVTRLAVEARHGGSHRVASTVMTVALVSAIAFGIALSSPGRGSVRSVLATRLMAMFRAQPTPAETRGERGLLYEGALALFREHPVVGIGLGGFRTEFPNVAAEVLRRPAKSTDHPPSLYLGTLVESGLAGAALLLLVLLGTVRGFGSALVFRGEKLEDSLRTAGAASAVLALLVVFLFGSHVVYPEIAALAGILTARLPLSPDGRTSRMLGALMPVLLAGALVLLLGGIVARAYETRLPEVAFARAETAGVYEPESEVAGRRFRWTSSAAAWRIGGAKGNGPGVRPASFPPSRLSLPVRNARPDARPVSLSIYWNDTLRGRVLLPAGGWRELTLPIDHPGVLRIHLSTVFRPPFDARQLGIEVGPEPVISVRPTG